MKNIRLIILFSVVTICFLNIVNAQDIESSIYTQDIPNNSTRYVTDNDGNLRMWINIWGHVNKPGNYLIHNNTDILTILAIAGGLRSGADLNKLKLYRELPDKQGNLKYTINMKEFIDTGSRKVFPEVLPNDAFYVPQTTSSYVLSNIRIVNTLLSTANLIYIFELRRIALKD